MPHIIIQGNGYEKKIDLDDDFDEVLLEGLYLTIESYKVTWQKVKAVQRQIEEAK